MFLADAVAGPAVVVVVGVVCGCCALGLQVDLQGLFFDFTMDSICEIAFAQNKDDSASTANFGATFDAAHHLMILTLRTGVFYLMPIKLMQPVWLENIFLGIFNRFHPAARQFQSKIAELDACCHDVIKRRRQDPNLAEARDLLALFMNATKDEASNHAL